jgi:heme-degrading monooxygenase HmoA
MEGDTAHFLRVTFWESEEAIRAFAGDDISVAKYYDFDKDFLLEPCSTHYEMYDK